MSKLISLGKIIDSSWDHYVRHFKSLMKISLWFFVIALVATIFTIINPANADQSIDIQEVFSASQAWLNISQGLITFFISSVVGAWILTVTLLLVNAQKANASTDQKQIQKHAWRVIIPIIFTLFFKAVLVLAVLLLLVPGTALLIFNTAGPQIPWLSAIGILLTFIGVISAFILAIYLGVSLHFSEYNLIFNRLKDVGPETGTVIRINDAWKTLKETRQLVKGRFWETLIKIVLPKVLFSVPIIVINVILVFAATVILSNILTFSPEAFEKMVNIIDVLISSGVSALMTPLLFIADFHVYDSLRKTRS